MLQERDQDALLTFKEAMSYLRVSRSTLYRLMWSGQLTGHKVGSTWRFYQTDLQANVQATPIQREHSSHETLATVSH
jgi:excisionase family DNA binding protein